MVNHLEFLRNEIENLKAQNLYSPLPILEDEQKARTIINGKKIINLSSNNYLGFANSSRLRKVATEAIQKWGFGTGAVRQICGTMPIHMEFEQQLAEYKKTNVKYKYFPGLHGAE